MVKKTKKKAMKKKATVVAVPTADEPSQGLKNAEAFFDQAETSPALMAALTVYQGNIMNLATTMGLAFTYDEMQEHLIKRWDVRKPTKKGYCCT